ncbi:tripartite tricarboxylate transporter permease, partial [Nonomuraea sp. NPDC004297]
IAFGPEDYFALAVLAFTAVSSVLSRSVVRGLASLGLGLAIGLIGIDQQTGQARLTLGIPQLLDGIDVVIVAVGLFALGEALYVASRLRHAAPEVAPVGRAWMGRADWRRSWRPWLRGTALGFPFGALPGGGAEIPTFLSYAAERRLARGVAREEYGKGAIEGVAGPEAANNASAAGTLVPLLTLGLPTSATAAILLAAFQQYGLQPGPQLFDHNPALVWAMIASLFIGNTMLLVLNLPMAPLWARVLRVPRPYLYAGIVLFAALGVYALNGSVVDLFVLYVLGLLGFAMRRFGLPVAPAVIGMILGPMAEIQLRRALAIGAGDVSVLVRSPIAAVLLVLSALALLAPLVRKLLARRGRAAAPAREE